MPEKRWLRQTLKCHAMQVDESSAGGHGNRYCDRVAVQAPSPTMQRNLRGIFCRAALFPEAGWWQSP
jgi:hypothetical protein